MLSSLKNDIGLGFLREMTPEQAYEVILKKFPRLKIKGKKRAVFMMLLRDKHKINLPICPNFLILEDTLCCRALGNPIPTTCGPPHSGKCILLNKKKRKELLAI